MKRSQGRECSKQLIHIFVRKRKWLTLDWNNQLRNDWENLSTALLKHVKDTLNSEETVGILLFSNSLEEDGQVVVVVELLDTVLGFPLNLKLRSMLNSNGQVSSIVESSEFTGRDISSIERSSNWFLRCWSFLWFVETNGFSTKTFALLKGSYT